MIDIKNTLTGITGFGLGYLAHKYQSQIMYNSYYLIVMARHNYEKLHRKYISKSIGVKMVNYDKHPIQIYYEHALNDESYSFGKYTYPLALETIFEDYNRYNDKYKNMYSDLPEITYEIINKDRVVLGVDALKYENRTFLSFSYENNENEVESRIMTHCLENKDEPLLSATIVLKKPVYDNQDIEDENTYVTVEIDITDMVNGMLITDKTFLFLETLKKYWVYQGLLFSKSNISVNEFPYDCYYDITMNYIPRDTFMITELNEGILYMNSGSIEQVLKQ